MLSFPPKIGVWLAITALALQLALSFGHVHFFEACSSHCGTAVTGTIAKANKVPAQEPADSNNEYCAVCASIQLADSTPRRRHTTYQARLRTERQSIRATSPA